MFYFDDFLADNSLIQNCIQVRMSYSMEQKQPKGRRWTANQKSFALSVLHSSPETYILLSKIFALPPLATLKNAMKQMDIHPGFNESILASLRMRVVAAMTDLEKIVSIAFDEMSIRQGLSHDNGKDVVEGFRHEQVRGRGSEPCYRLYGKRYCIQVEAAIGIFPHKWTDGGFSDKHFVAPVH